MSELRFIKKRDGATTRFNQRKIENAIIKAARSAHIKNPEDISKIILPKVIEHLSKKFQSSLPAISDIDSLIINTSKELGYENLGVAYDSYSKERAKIRDALEIIKKSNESNSTDAALLIESDSKYTQMVWDRKRIENQLIEEANLSSDLAKDISKKVENVLVGLYMTHGIRRLKTRDIRGLTDLILTQEGLDEERKKQELLGLPASDLERAIFSRSQENSNVSTNNPEAVNLFISESILKQYALDKVFSKEVTDAHLDARIHLHDLGYIDRVYCSSHSLEYIKKYGLNRLLSNLESKSNSPNSAAVLNQHVQTFLASMQAHYAGALGFGFLNILYSSLLNRPVNIIEGNIDSSKWSLEKKSLEWLISQNEITLNKEEASDKTKFFEKTGEKTELKEVPYSEFEQVAQNLIYASSQNAFSRGGQTLFIDFNIHTGVPHYMKNVPAIGPGGTYLIQMPDGAVKKVPAKIAKDSEGFSIRVDDVPRRNNPEDLTDIRNGDADNSRLEGEYAGGKILTYGDFEKTAQKYARALLSVWQKGDKDGRPFHFPKCDLHIDKNSFEDQEQEKIVDYASQITSENGSVYFMFDRGDGAVLAQCCRLKEKITDSSMLKYPERLRFCGFQNVTINLPQTAYRGKTLEGTLNEIDTAMGLAYQAHFQKKEFIQDLLDKNGSPLRNLGKPSDDGTAYIDLKKSTYIIGNIGLDEAVQVLTGKQLHESKEAYETGLKIIARMYQNIQKFKEKSGLKFTIEETPAESTTRRLAKVDSKNFEDAKKVVKGTEENPYYTNSIHFAPDAEVGMIDRVVGQSKFHNMIESGAIVHAYIGEKRPDKDTIKKIVKKTLEETTCSQLVFSPTYTECDKCGNVMAGEKELCTNNQCKNNSKETLEKDSLFAVTRVVGYYSRIPHWNGSQQQIYKDRKSAEEYYAGIKGKDLSWLYNPNGHEKLTIMQFGKEGCFTCENVKDNVNKKIKALNLEGKVDYKIYYLNKPTEEGLVNAALYDVPFDTVPTLVIAGKGSYWKKTTKYAPKPDKMCADNSCNLNTPPVRSDLIKGSEIEEQLKILNSQYE